MLLGAPLQGVSNTSQALLDHNNASYLMFALTDERFGNLVLSFELFTVVSSFSHKYLGFHDYVNSLYFPALAVFCFQHLVNPFGKNTGGGVPAGSARVIPCQ